MNRFRIVAAALALAAASAVSAQDYPVRPVRVVVPWTPGGGADVTARIVTVKLSELMGQPFLVENKAGATGTIGTDFVAKSAPDGYTLVLGTNSTFVIAVALGSKLNYDPDRDLTPIARISSVPHILAVHPSLATNTVGDLIAAAKANPGKLAFGSSGNGSTPQLAGETFKLMADIDLLHIPYKGSGQSLQDTVSGVVQVSFDTLPSLLGHLKSGRLKPVAVLGPKRVSSLPDLPTIAEAGLPGAEGLTWFGLYGPGGLPQPIVQKLHAALVTVLKMPDVKTRFEALGAEDGTGENPQQFAVSAKAEVTRYARVAKSAGIKGE